MLKNRCSEPAVEEDRGHQPPDLAPADVREAEVVEVPFRVDQSGSRTTGSRRSAAPGRMQEEDARSQADDQGEGQRGPAVDRPFPAVAEVAEPLPVVGLLLLGLLADLPGRGRRRPERGVRRVG